MTATVPAVGGEATGLGAATIGDGDPLVGQPRRRWGLQAAVVAVLLFLNGPVLVVFLYAFTTEDQTFTFPPPGFTLHWFDVAWDNQDVRDALWLSVRVAGLSTALALVLGTLAAGAVSRSRFFGRDAVSLLLVLPLALPGIVTGIALRSSINVLGVGFSFWTIVVGHATFCIVVVYNNALARLRRTSGSIVEASMDLGATGFQTFVHVLLPNIATALLAGGMLAFALSFDEVIVTRFTSPADERTVPLWIFDNLVGRPRNRPVTNVVAMVVVLVMLVPIFVAQRLSSDVSLLGSTGGDAPDPGAADS
jgi:putative spermidine/putrescine transport system permease protein